ncbi:MAG: amidohydrolase family protein [Rhodospirillaceae bacterium]|nr:amidohydrolase family protein [Rhodospirillaceae bacterium]
MLKTGFAAGLIAAAFIVAPASAATKAIKFGKLVDGSGKVTDNAVVVVTDNKITSVGTGAPPAGAEVIDLTAFTGIPGMIDVHTHMTYGPDPTTRASRTNATNMILGRDGLQKTLESGVTTVRDMNASDYLDISMRELINMGVWTGPRMYVVGCGLRATRSRFNPAGAPLGCGEGNGPNEFARAARQQIAAGVDWIKIFGSTGSGDDVTQFQTVTYEEMKAAVDIAHSMGKRVGIHSYGPGGARDAIRAGADSLEHATDMDDATIAELVKKKIYFVPTIDHNRYYFDNAERFKYPPGAKANLTDFIARNLETTRKAVKAGAMIAMGSDAIYEMFGQNTRELGWFVKAGMTPAQALASATTVAAGLMGMEKSIGQVAPGFFADIAAVDGDPLKDVDVTINKVRWVMKDGAVVVDKTRK